MVYLSFIVAIVAFIIIRKTKVGLKLNAVGENPAAADAAGISVGKYRCIATIIGGCIMWGGRYVHVYGYQRRSVGTRMY